jgi:acyl-CoA thioesterase
VTYEFDDDTALEPAGPGRWRGAVSDRWWIAEGPNGGYIASFLIRAMANEAQQPDPLTMTTHFLSRPDIAPVDITVEHLHTARSHHFLEARMVQDGRIRATATATFGRLRADNPVSMQGEIPEPPEPESAEAFPVPDLPNMAFRDRLECRVASPRDRGLGLEEPGPARVGGWTRFADGRPLDVLAVPLFMDSWPPPMFATFLGGLAPTIELSVYWRSRPATTWHLAVFRSRFLMNGYTDEDGELWDETGRLVAISRQLARFVPPGRQAAAPPVQPPAAR